MKRIAGYQKKRMEGIRDGRIVRGSGSLSAVALILLLCLLLSSCSGGKGGTATDYVEAAESGASSEVSSEVSSDSPGEAVISQNAEASTGIDVVIVMDASGSMLSSDRDLVAIEAAKLFIDMELSTGIGTAVVVFSDHVENSGLVEITEAADKEALKEMLDAVEYRNLACTDTGAALLAAVGTLQASISNNDKAIILFTDGNTEITTNASRTLKDSLADVETATETAAENGYPIYAVGLNRDGSVDEGALEEITDRTGGRTLITSEVDSLPTFFNEIFKELGSIDEIFLSSFTATGESQEVRVPIDNSEVLEANIVMLSGEALGEVRLCDPDGEEVDLSDEDAYVLSISDHYAVLKLTRPAQGDWTLYVKGVSGDQISISLLYNYDISLVTSYSSNQVKGEETIILEAYLDNAGSAVTDEAFYEGLTGTVTLQSDADGSAHTLTLERTGTMLTAAITLPTVGSYQASVHIEGQGLYRDSEPVVLTRVNQEIILTDDTLPWTLRPGDKGTLDLADYFSDPDGDALSYQAEADDGTLLEVQVEDDVLTYEVLERGATILRVTAEDGAGSSAELTIACEIDSLAGRCLPYLLPLIMLAFILLLILFARRRARRATGYLSVNIEGRAPEACGMPRAETYALAQGIPVASLGRRFTLQQLLFSFQRYYASVNFEEKALSGLDQLLSAIRTDSAAVVFCPTKNRQTMRVRVGGNARFCDLSGNPEEDLKQREISCRDMHPTAFSIRIPGGARPGNDVIVRLTYKYMAL